MPTDTIDLAALADLLDAATIPEDVFGTDRPKATYRRLVRAAHPDHNGGEGAEVFRALEELWQQAQRLIADGTYGKTRTPIVTVKARRRSYVIEGRVTGGDISDLYRTADGLLVKVARRPRDNDLIRNEATTLRHLRRTVEDRWLPFLPEILDTIAIRQPGGTQRQANVLRPLDGFYTLEEVIADYPEGLDARDMAWVWRRLLAVLGAAHAAGVTHGAVLPTHVMIHPEKHGLVLVGWGASTTGRKVSVVSRGYRNFYPPEVLTKSAQAPGTTDVFMGARTMLALTGSAWPPSDRMPVQLRSFFRACCLPRDMRPDNAWALQATFDDLLERLYGPRRFRPFTMKRR